MAKNTHKVDSRFATILGVRTYICFVLVLFRRDCSNKYQLYPAIRSQHGACLHLTHHMLLQGSQGLQHQTPWDWHGVRKQRGWGMTNYMRIVRISTDAHGVGPKMLR